MDMMACCSIENADWRNHLSAPTNPLRHHGIPRFDQIKAEHVLPAVDDLVSQVSKQLEILETNAQPTWIDLVETIEDIEESLEMTWGPVGHLLAVANSEELRRAYEAAQPKIVALGLRMAQSESIFRKLEKLKSSVDWQKLSSAQKRIVENSLREMQLSGIALTGAKRERFNEIAKRLSQITTDFSNNILDSIKLYSLIVKNPKDVEGMPDSFLAMAAQSFNAHKSQSEPAATPKSGPWRVTLDHPSYMPFMKLCPNRDLREKIYRAFIARASDGRHDNTELMSEILSLRQEKAKLLGFATYAELSLSRKMAGTPRRVYELIDQLHKASYEAAQKENHELAEVAHRIDGITNFNHWDVNYYAEKLQEQRYQFTEEELKPYFSLPSVLKGLFELLTEIFDIRVVNEDGKAPVWHPDVQYFGIYSREKQRIAGFFLDPYSRPADKRGGAWMNECVIRRKRQEIVQQPEAYLVCNFAPPVDGAPSLLTFRDVQTLFHEFGHGLQHMLTQVDYLGASGIRGIEWDAVELPSQFMENWCYHRQTLMGFARHYKSGAQLPDDLFQKLLSSRTYRAGSMMLRQLHFAAVDIELHDRFDPSGGRTAFEIDQQISRKMLALPSLEDDRMLCSFAHIFAGGYSAGYYSYKWAEVLSADAFAAFEEAGLNDSTKMRSVGARFRDTVLSLGGSIHPMEVFKQFRGREPSVDALLRHCGLES
jgi:oligopeptidase A